ncbi:hypothetical protein GCU56_18750 [Geodermatophilus sabuli]|uniref:Camelysin metallo-endopeptidase n=1 Tax=Geodermatophilus sabuli TaxID=1564158 RepID=A0A7K3W5C7_9ACTN|nr:hypothetical protein [Geodermatophilus sabuli]NEK59898.1 hypothetical protein [Geodermatophilus sabuli]
MTISSNSRRTTAKIIGSIGVVGAVAAVAGLGTFGTFTDSTTPVDTGVKSGVLSLDLGMPAHTANVPFVPGGLLPGDAATDPIDLVNSGTVPLSSVSLKVVATTSSVLDTDTVNGLQLTVTSCSDPWTVAGTGYTCAGSVTDLYSGPIVMDAPLLGAESLEAGGRDHLLISAALPVSAGDTFQNAKTVLSFVFTGTQRGGTAR